MIGRTHSEGRFLGKNRAADPQHSTGRRRGKVLTSLAMMTSLAALLGNASAGLNTAVALVPRVVLPVLASSTQFDITGFAQSATLDATCMTAAATALPDAQGNPASKHCGGTVTLNGHVIIVPAETIAIMPAAAFTWEELFGLAPAPYGLTPTAVGATGPETGMALTDLPKPLTTYEFQAVGNRIINGVGDRYIAGLIHVTQQGLNGGAGYINFMNYVTGEMRVGGLLGDSTTGARVMINDPAITAVGDPAIGTGRYGRASDQTLQDRRLQVDQDNPTIASASGFPMCFPRTDPSTGIDAMCPQTQRPINAGAPQTFIQLYGTNAPVPAVNEVQTLTLAGVSAGDTFTVTFGTSTSSPISVAATALDIQTALQGMASIGAGNVTVTGPVGGPFSLTFGGTLAHTNVALVSTAVSVSSLGTVTSVTLTQGVDPAVATPSPSPYFQAPFEVGDYITYAGTLTPDKVGIGTFISAHTIVDNTSITTFPGTDPAYTTIEVSLIGTGGLTVFGAGEAAIRTKFEGMSTDQTRPVYVYAIDTDKLGNTTDRYYGTIMPDPGTPIGAVRGRWRMRPPCAQFGTISLLKPDKQCLNGPDNGYLPPPREIRAVIASAIPDVPALFCTAQSTVPPLAAVGDCPISNNAYRGDLPIPSNPAVPVYTATVTPATITDGGLAVNEVQTLTLAGRGLVSYKVTLGASTSAPILASQTAGGIQAALEAMASIGVGGVTVIGPVGGPFTLTFAGTLANTNVAQVTTIVTSYVDPFNVTSTMAKSANGLFYGQYHAPIGEYIFPENTPGNPIVENNFNSIPFLTIGGYSSITGVVNGTLDPWPSDLSPIAGCFSAVPTIGVVPSPVAASAVIQLQASSTGANVVYHWTATAGVFSNATIANPTWTAPNPTADQNVTLSLTVSNPCTLGSAAVTANVLVNALPPVFINPTVNQPAPQSVLTPSDAVFTVTGTDPQAGGLLTFTASPVENILGFTATVSPSIPVDPLTGATVTVHNTTPGVYHVNIQARDNVSNLLSLTVVATITVTAPAIADRPIITTVLYRQIKQRFIVTATDLPNPTAVLRVQPYLRKSDCTAFGPLAIATNVMINNAGSYTYDLVGAPQPALVGECGAFPVIPYGVKVVSSLGATSATFTAIQIRAN